MYIDVSKSIQNGKTYYRYLLRESYRENGKVKQRTVGNISHCSQEEIEALRFALKHKTRSINCLTIETDAVSYNRIPEPRELRSQLLNALSFTLPKAIPNSGIKVSTRKKLELKRKK